MFDISPTSESLVSGWIPRFQSADENIVWLDVEREFSIPLDDDTLLVGRIDALGIAEEYRFEFAKTGVWTPACAPGTFFSEWKSQGLPPAYKKNEWKLTWRMNPQSLTYGVAGDHLYPGMRRFTVRKAFKSTPPQYDYEWFSYETAEIDWWRGELIRIADEIRQRRKSKVIPWSPNFNNCYKWGPKYVCSRFHAACSQLDWNARPVEAIQRVPHLDVEIEALKRNETSFGSKMNKNLVILDASRVDTWTDCKEKYRGHYEEGMTEPPGEALKIGSDFHALLKAYYGRLIPKQPA